MDRIHKTPTEISNMNRDGQFRIYDRGSNENILFLGSCRHSPLMFYYSLLNPNINICCIYTPFWDSNNISSLPISSIKNVLSNTRIIITETIRSYGVLNTDKQQSNNFFETFSCNDINEVRMPNLHLAIYLYDIIQLCKKHPTAYRQTFDESLARLKRSIYSKGFDDLYDFIIEHISELRMFYTFNHPSAIVSMFVFKILMEKLGEKDKIPDGFFEKMAEYNFLGGHATPITQFDISSQNFTFPTKVFEDSIIEKPDMLYILQPYELEIPNKYLKIV